MKKRWNTMGKMAACSFAAAMMVMIGTESEMTAHAEMLIDIGEDIQSVQEMVPESENADVLLSDTPVMQDTQEAGDTDETKEPGINIMQVVTIEENLVPGSSEPDIGVDLSVEPETGSQDVNTEVEAQEESETPQNAEEQAEAGTPQDADAQAEAGELQDTDEQEGSEAPQDADGQEEKPETGVSGTITYEDSEVAVTVTATEAAQLPANTEVKVTRLEEGSEEYEEAKEAARQSVGAGENATYAFYDVTLESEGQALDVEEGTVSVKMEFKADAAKREVVSIEETESGKVARNVTDREATGRSGSVALSYSR